jgi:carboxyl-terminal processing protease
MTFKGIVFAQFNGKMDRTDLYFDAFSKYLLRNRLDMTSKNKTIVNAISRLNLRQLYGKQLLRNCFKRDAMVKAVLK